MEQKNPMRYFSSFWVMISNY